jgi:hypothetical protein
MGRFVKNKELKSGSYSTRLPMGSNAIGPNSPVEGLVRFNIDRNEMELYANRQWKTVKVLMEAEKGTTKDTFYGDGTTRTFGPMKFVYATGQEIKILVFIGNVFQNPGVAYTVDDDNINFSSAPPDGQTVVILHGFAG